MPPLAAITEKFIRIPSPASHIAFPFPVEDHQEEKREVGDEHQCHTDAGRPGGIVG